MVPSRVRKSPYYFFFLSFMHLRTGLFVTRTVHELIFGYNDSLLTFVSTLMAGMLIVPRSVFLNHANTGVDPYFALQYNYTTAEDVYNKTGMNILETGKNNISNIHNYIMWNVSKLSLTSYYFAAHLFFSFLIDKIYTSTCKDVPIR